MEKTGDLTPGACRDCAHVLVSVYAEPCKTCHLSSVHKAWRPKESEETNTYMEGKGCENCRWRYAPTNTPPCSKCDGFELDKWELHEWTAAEITRQALEDHGLAAPEITEYDKENIRVLRKLLGEDEGKRHPDTQTSNLREEIEEVERKMREASTGKPVYQQRIEERIAAQVAKGREKYGVTLEDNVTLTEAQRIEHLEEELIDALMYCEHLAAAGRERGLTADDYQRAALRTAQVTTMTNEDLILNGVMGLSGEAGECIDLVKKVRFQGHALDRDKFLLELGDVAWYLAVAAHGAGFRLSEVFEANVDKLKKRYPDGFDKARSMNRAGEVTGTEA